MKETGGHLMHYAGWTLLFVFTATCTVMLLGEYAPPTAPWLPFAGLAVFEFGVIHWLHWHKHNALNAVQSWIALIMAFVSALAIAGCTGLELLKWFNAAGDLVLQPWWKDVVLYSIVGCITLNVLAFIGVSLSDPKHVAKLHAYKDHPQFVEVRVNATARETYDGRRFLASQAATQLPAQAASLDRWNEGNQEQSAMSAAREGGSVGNTTRRPFRGVKSGLSWLWNGEQAGETMEPEQSNGAAQSAEPTSADTETQSS